MSAWSAASLHAIERVPMPEDGAAWIPVRAHFDIGAFGINAWAGDAGAELVGPHDEVDDFAGGHEELYVVLSGRAQFRVGDEVVDAAAGTAVFVRERTLTRSAVAVDNGTIILTVGGAQGVPFRVAAWEYLVKAGARARDGDVDGAVAIVRDGLEECPGSAELLYHLACYESLAGRLEDARAHLAESVTRDPANRDRSEREPDLEALRMQPRG